jgi:butyryl-CoA dehydrogenase
MPIYQAPLQDFQFLIEHFLPFAAHGNVQGFDEARGMAQPVLEAAATLCEEVLFPLNQSGDREGLRYHDGSVTTPSGFREAYLAYCEGGWPSFTCDPAYGGQGLPEWLNIAVMEMACSANLSFGLTPGLSHGACQALAQHGSQGLKEKYLPKLVSGVWSGVMCLTEPQAGTDLGLVRTSARPAAHPAAHPADDGSYRITGGKIFISSGEHDLTENILHLVLARLPDAPKGIKGISLFLVPKFLVNEDGTLGPRNGVHCEGIEHKMGIHASPTCSMRYEEATGWLIGEPHQGMRNMFTMMNAARLYVGVQGLGIAEIAFQNALLYARERLQSRSVTGAKAPLKPADPIIVHPDLRRMLLEMRAFTEGARALAMLTAFHHDLAHRHADPLTRQEADDFVQLVTPIVKSWFTESGTRAASLAMQVHGGYGYIREYGIEQYLRDARIAEIYEGTNGIQALDLIGRKLSARNGRYLRAFFHPLEYSLARCAGEPGMEEFVQPLQRAAGHLRKATWYVLMAGLKNPEDAASAASEYLRLFALVLFGWVWLEQASIAARRQTGDSAFEAKKLATARFFMRRLLPETSALLQSLSAGAGTLDIG